MKVAFEFQDERYSVRFFDPDPRTLYTGGSEQPWHSAAIGKVSLVRLRDSYQLDTLMWGWANGFPSIYFEDDVVAQLRLWGIEDENAVCDFVRIPEDKIVKMICKGDFER